jgi:hypothetical protein
MGVEGVGGTTPSEAEAAVRPTTLSIAVGVGAEVGIMTTDGGRDEDRVAMEAGEERISTLATLQLTIGPVA